MAGQAKSAKTKKREAHQSHDDLMHRAVLAYHRELAKAPGIKRHGAHTICRDFKQLNMQETGSLIKLSYSTLIRLAAGGQTLAEVNAEKSWLTVDEAEVVLSFVEELGNQGFPLSHR
ncbi:hypothetical protein DFH29DRAFT_819053 [Suillus ampliporus]|nr:hypothetical protein DFH29DRAFT_819053 [Suillus ampliporus]